MHNIEVISFTDRDKRDEVFDTLRKHGNAQERQVVRFSDVELTGQIDAQERLTYRDVWSVAYPRH